MKTIDHIRKVAESFVCDACNFLHLDSSSIRVIFTPFIEPVCNIPQYASVLPDDTIVVSDEFLKECAQHGCTPLRLEMYARTRYVAKRRKYGMGYQWIPEGSNDAFAYSIALMLLKGLQIYCPPMIEASLFFAPALRILSEEFMLDGTILKMPTEPINGAYYYKVKLNEKSSIQMLQLYNKRINYVSQSPNAGELGSLENPFENVNEAISYLQTTEKLAYEKDSVLNSLANMNYYYDLTQNSFRISWASPYVAIRKNSYPSTSFLMSQMAPLDPNKPEEFYFSLKPNLYKHKFLYRGQSDYYEGKPCVPNLFRDKEHNDKGYYLDFLIFSQEMELLIKSHPIVQLLENGIEMLHDIFRIRMHYPGLAQHYYNKSQYLDLTSDINVMKFFATTDYDHVTDKYYPVTDTNKVGVIYYYELKYPEAFQQHRGYALKTIGKQVFLRSGAQCGFLLEMEKGVDFKTLPEVRAVYFKHNPELSAEIYKNSNSGNDYFPEDILQEAWHNRLKERYENKVVSRKAVELNVSRNDGESIESITSKLNDLGIKVDDFIPEFSKEELTQFYNNIETWWINFCNDIHFSDAEDELYRQAMREIINQNKYKWAFQPQFK